MRQAGAVQHGRYAVSIHAPRCRGAMPARPRSRRLIRRFQSTPPVAEGRCIEISAGASALACFNPRPPLPRGDAEGSDAARGIDAVSIHAPRCRGAMPPRSGRLCPRRHVSIHAPRCRGAMPGVARPGDRRTTMFQSTPPVAEGRCGHRRLDRLHRRRFNPRPPLPRGDAIEVEPRQSVVTVSIHAPRCRGAMRGGNRAFPASTCFNPRPPLPRGDALSPSHHLFHVVVSIHAPRCRGAMHCYRVVADGVEWFQSTPPVAEGRCRNSLGSKLSITLVSIHAPRCRGAMPASLDRRRGQCIRFNPRPPLPRGDARQRPPCRYLSRRFNPRPPLPRGDARYHLQRTDSGYAVSIHAPRCRGAMPAATGRRCRRQTVSIHAPRCRGAMPERATNGAVRCEVSIHAPRCRGAMPNPDVSGRACIVVSIHAPRCRGAMRVEVVPRKPVIRVSIHAPRCRGAMRALPRQASGMTKFQSTPPVAEGRCWRNTRGRRFRPCFNPRPPLPRGDAILDAHDLLLM